MSLSPVPTADFQRYCRRVPDLSCFRVEHVDLLFDRANDNERGARARPRTTGREAVSKLGHPPAASFDAVERPVVDA
jgi:hypothetical protein